MTRRIANPSTQICAMCPYWNEAIGGLFVNPRTNQRNFLILTTRRSKRVTKIIL